MTGDFWVDFNNVYGRWGNSYVDALITHKHPQIGSNGIVKGRWFLLCDDDGNSCLAKVKKVDKFGIIKFKLDIESFETAR